MNLDQPGNFTRFDKNKVLESVGAFKDQCLQAWKDASILKFPDEYKQVENVVVCGMGGSRFTPLAVKHLLKDKIKVSYEIVDDYSLPAYVNKNTLVILSSYSGTTEEVISCGQEAFQKGAKVTAVSMLAGTTEKMIEEKNGVGYFFTPTHNPSGQPRLGSGYMLFGHIGLLFALDLVTLDKNEVDSGIAKISEFAARYQANLETQTNPAKQLAEKIKNNHPFIVTAEFLKGFGNGFANQINETAKNISDPRNISELNHHLLEGLKYPDELHSTGLFVLIKSAFYSTPIQKRFSITKDVIEKNGLKTLEIELTGSTKIEQILEAFTLSGYTTYYMAMLGDVDPVAVPWVDYFKEQLKK